MVRPSLRRLVLLSPSHPLLVFLPAVPLLQVNQQLHLSVSFKVLLLASPLLQVLPKPSLYFCIRRRCQSHSWRRRSCKAADTASVTVSSTSGLVDVDGGASATVDATGTVDLMGDKLTSAVVKTGSAAVNTVQLPVPPLTPLSWLTPRSPVALQLLSPTTPVVHHPNPQDC